jgi:hypothetical protein
MTPSSSLREKVLADAAAHKARTRTEGRRRAVLIYTIAALLGLPLFFAWGGIDHSSGRPLALTVGIAAGGLLLAVACASVAFLRGKSLVGRPLFALAAVSFLAPVVTYVWLVSWHTRYVEPFSRLGLRCLTLTLVSGAPLLLAAVYVRKRTMTVHPIAAGAALGAAAGAFGGISTELWCPLTNSPHVLLGHAFPIVLLAIVGAMAGRFVLPLRAR